jgi:hypothetical protein
MSLLLPIAAALFLMSKRDTKNGGGKEPIGKAADDGQRLVARATTKQAMAWAPLFVVQGSPPMAADCLARWAGIESGGDPLARSSKGERGLFQCGAVVAKMVYTQAEWDSLASPATTREEHARLALKLARWCWTRGFKYIKNPPSNPIDQVWYAKLYHQWPVDVKDGSMHGPAMLMARQLEGQWAGNPRQMHYLRAANVIAWAVPTP